jgi:hypothetical protein
MGPMRLIGPRGPIGPILAYFFSLVLTAGAYQPMP